MDYCNQRAIFHLYLVLYCQLVLCVFSNYCNKTLHRSPEYDNSKPDIAPIKQQTVATRMECAYLCIQDTCQSVFYSANDHSCLIYGNDIRLSSYHDHDGMRRYDTVSTDYERDCYDIMMKGNKNDGVYQIRIPGSTKPNTVYCDMTSQDPGWIVIQRRTDGSEDFHRDWSDYNHGFGNLSNEFWLGNWKLNRLTRGDRFKLRIELEDFENKTAYAVYDSFKVRNKNQNFKLLVNGYSGTAGDSFSIHDSMKFTTKDHDNDDDADNNCADVMHGGWWFRACQECNLNGKYGSTVGEAGITWNDWRGKSNSLKKSLMKIRRLENDP